MNFLEIMGAIFCFILGILALGFLWVLVCIASPQYRQEDWEKK